MIVNGCSASPRSYSRAATATTSPHRTPHSRSRCRCSNTHKSSDDANARSPEDDVWTILSTVEIETDEGEHTSLAEIELDMFFFLLTVAGSETTRNAIAGGLIAVLDHPDQLSVLRREPDAMKPAVEEILRWSSPVAHVLRGARPVPPRSAASPSPKATASPCGTHRRTVTPMPSTTRSGSTSP